MSGQSSLIVMACPHCRSHLRVPTAALGTQRKCPICSGAVSVPSTLPKAAAGPSHARDEFGFVCQLCGSRLYANPTQIGKTLDCPDCHSTNEVPAPTKAVPRKIFESGEAFDLQLASDEPGEVGSTALPDANSYRVHCRTCESTVYCRPDQQGTEIRCPDCGATMLVPPPPPPRKKIVLSGADADIEVAPTFEIPVKKTNAEKLLAAATAKVEEADRKKHKPPQRPFRDDVLSFPFQLRVFPCWVVLALLGSATMALFLNGAALAQKNSLDTIFGLFLLMPLGILILIWTLMSANIYLSIIQWTAMGFRTIEDWGGVEPWQWIRKLFFFVNALTVSCFPGFVLGLVVPFVWLDLVISAIFIFFLFPYILLCMLDEETPITIHSSFIWKTTSACRNSWRKFYALTGAIGLSVVVLHGGLTLIMMSTRATWLGHITLAYTMLAAVWYFRVLGRLAWILDAYHATLPRESDSDDSEMADRLPLGHTAQA